MTEPNKREQEHIVARDRVSVLEKKYKENRDAVGFDELIIASIDLLDRNGHIC